MKKAPLTPELEQLPTSELYDLYHRVSKLLLKRFCAGEECAVSGCGGPGIYPTTIGLECEEHAPESYTGR